MIVLSQGDVANLLPMRDAIEVIDRAMRDVSAGGAQLPLRTIVPVGGENRMGVMPGAIGDPPCFGVKLVSLFPDNPAKGISSHRGALVLFEPETGGAIAMMDASLLTAIRTAAASAVATRALARADARVLAIIGYGEQALHHLEAMLAVREVSDVRVAGRSATRAAAFCAAAARKHPQLRISSGTDVAAAVKDADVICTVTASREPILRCDWVADGAHVNVVGSSIATMREIDDDLVTRASIWVDYLPSTLAQAGEIIAALQAGRLIESDLRGEIGAYLDGDAPGRQGPEEVTLYRSLGIAAQDLAAAHFITERARATGAGQRVTF